MCSSSQKAPTCAAATSRSRARMWASSSAGGSVPWERQTTMGVSHTSHSAIQQISSSWNHGVMRSARHNMQEDTGNFASFALGNNDGVEYKRRVGRYHFSGIAGAGMNPLARLLRAHGHIVQGSDRSFDQGKNGDLAASLRALGIDLEPQDGGAVTSDLDRFVYSTAVEADTPEMRAARDLGIERVARPALLAELVGEGRPGIAIAGTSGKSTVTGMLAWLARESGVPGTVIGGAALVGDGEGGCFVAGAPRAPAGAGGGGNRGPPPGHSPGLGGL